jgi:phosphoribosylanthranilate isomerase
VYQAFSELHLAAIDMDSGAYRLCKDELEVPVILRLHYSPSISYHYYLGQEDKIVAIVLEIDDIESVSSTHLQSLCSQYKTILKSKLSTEQLKDILTTVTPYGIELDGSSEVSLGLKSYDEINELIELIEAD